MLHGLVTFQPFVIHNGLQYAANLTDVVYTDSYFITYRFSKERLPVNLGIGKHNRLDGFIHRSMQCLMQKRSLKPMNVRKILIEERTHIYGNTIVIYIVNTTCSKVLTDRFVTFLAVDNTNRYPAGYITKQITKLLKRFVTSGTGYKTKRTVHILDTRQQTLILFPCISDTLGSLDTLTPE